MRRLDLKKNLLPTLLLVLLAGLILCPLISVFAKAVIVDGRLDLVRGWQTIAAAENRQTVGNSLLLGLCVVLCSTVIAVPTAYLLARTQLSKHGWLDIVFMIPFMTPPYIASMGWILFMQKRGLFQQLFPGTGAWSEGFFCLHPGPPYRILRVYHGHSPLFHHGPHRFRTLRQPVLHPGVHLYGHVAAAE